jgi:hypothetical protein
MMGHREPLKGGDEYDAFTPWRKVCCWGKGTVHKIKHAFHRRVRRTCRATLRAMGDGYCPRHGVLVDWDLSPYRPGGMTNCPVCLVEHHLAQADKDNIWLRKDRDRLQEATYKLRQQVGDTERMTRCIAYHSAHAKLLRDQLMPLRAEYIEVLEDVLVGQGHTVTEPGDPMHGWIDTMALSPVRDAGDKLVELGIYERASGEGHGRRQFYKKIVIPEHYHFSEPGGRLV